MRGQTSPAFQLLLVGEPRMLTYMRKNAGSWIVKVIFAVIIIVFVFFYGYGSKQGPEERVLVTVGAAKITTAQYRKAYSNMLQMYQQAYQNQINDQLSFKKFLNLTKIILSFRKNIYFFVFFCSLRIILNLVCSQSFSLIKLCSNFRY